MLFLSPRSAELTRAQGCLIDDMEVRKTVKFLKTIAKQSFEPQLTQLKGSGDVSVDEESMNDPLFDKAVQIVLETKRGSVSLLQRRLTIGYARSSRLIEAMAASGILGDHKGSQAREVQITPEEWEMMKQMQSEQGSSASTQAETASAVGTQPQEEAEEESPAYAEDVITDEDMQGDDSYDEEEDDDVELEDAYEEEAEEEEGEEEEGEDEYEDAEAEYEEEEGEEEEEESDEYEDAEGEYEYEEEEEEEDGDWEDEYEEYVEDDEEELAA